MSATKILWGQVLLVSAVVLAFLCAATEWTAWKLGFQTQLGHPWFEALAWPFYQPPAFFWWWFAYDAYRPDNPSPAARRSRDRCAKAQAWVSPGITILVAVSILSR
jgi:type IV secretory pathway TraG/TraD family ATPase VirD4